MSEYGIKIKNIQAGSLYEHNLGVRDYFSYTNAMFTNNLLGYYLLDKGLRVKNDSTRDIICINFDFGSRSYLGNLKHIEKLIKNETNENKLKNLEYIKTTIEANKNKHDKKSKEEIRKIFYQDGVNVTYTTRDSKGNIKKQKNNTLQNVV